MIELGGGRHRKDDELDLSVGIELFAPIGTEVVKGQVIARVHAATQEKAVEGLRSVESAVKLSSTPVPLPPLILKQF